MFVYGDIHGDFDWMKKVHAKCVRDPYAIQLGDFGIGFPPQARQDFANLDENEWTFPPPFPETFAFIAGNHDDPDLCRTHPNCLGDYGYLEDGDIFYIRGAPSIDKECRTSGINWWYNEELSWAELEAMIALFIETEPKYVVSHTCPASLFSVPMVSKVLMATFGKNPNRTAEALGLALARHQPEKWFFGHFHTTAHADIGKTRFYVVGIKQRIEVPGVSFSRPKIER